MPAIYRNRDPLRDGSKKRSIDIPKKKWKLVFSDDFTRENTYKGPVENNWIQNLIYTELLSNSAITYLGINNNYYNQTVTGGNADWGHIKTTVQRNKEKYSLKENYKIKLIDCELASRNGDPYGGVNFAMSVGGVELYDIYGSPHYVWTPTQTPTIPTFMINKTPSSAGQVAFGYNGLVQTASSFGFGTLNGSTYFSMNLEFLNKEKKYRLKVWQTGYPEPDSYLIDTLLDPREILSGGNFLTLNTAISADWAYPVCRLAIKKIEIYQEAISE